MGWGTAEKFYSYQRKCQAWVGWEQTANTDTQATIKVTGCARSGDGSGYYYAYDFGVSVRIFYRIDGGSWHELKRTTTVLNYGAEVGNISASFTINRTHKTQAVEVACDAISTTGDWPTATAKMTINVNAKTSYTISLNANKPSGASADVANMPANQTKWYGEALTLPNTSPTLNLYNFKGWNTKADGTGTSYAPGATYPASSNAAATLYAQWELAYAFPTIDPATVIRCDSSGNATEDGTYGKASFTWSIDTTADGGANAGKRAVISWKPTTTASWDGASSTTVTISGTGGTVNRVFGTISTDTSYDVRIAVTDTHTIDGNECTAYRYLTLSQAFFTMDFLAGGHGVAMGTAATQTGAFELAMDFDHSGGVTLDATAKAAWLDALGLTVENRTLTPNTSNVTMQGESYARSFGKVVQLNLVFTTNKQIPTWDNQNFIVGTMDRACAYSKQYMTAIAQINSQWTLMQAGVNSSGEVRLRTVGTAIPNGTWVWVFGTYISV